MQKYTGPEIIKYMVEGYVLKRNEEATVALSEKSGDSVSTDTYQKPTFNVHFQGFMAFFSKFQVFLCS